MWCRHCCIPRCITSIVETWNQIWSACLWSACLSFASFQYNLLCVKNFDLGYEQPCICVPVKWWCQMFSLSWPVDKYFEILKFVIRMTQPDSVWLSNRTSNIMGGVLWNRSKIIREVGPKEERSDDQFWNVLFWIMDREWYYIQLSNIYHRLLSENTKWNISQVALGKYQVKYITGCSQMILSCPDNCHISFSWLLCIFLVMYCMI